MSERKSNSKTLTKRALTRRRNGARRLAARRKTPLGRLQTDGSCKPENVRRRLQWLAYERQIPEKDLPKVQCNPTDELFDFAEKYHISLDWLLCGDLKGLHRMTENLVPASPRLSGSRRGSWRSTASCRLINRGWYPKRRTGCWRNRRSKGPREHEAPAPIGSATGSGSPRTREGGGDDNGPPVQAGGLFQ
jgi:hypothetical protein